MENLDLREILKNVPKGTKLYSPLFGECSLYDVNSKIELLDSKNNEVIYTLETNINGAKTQYQVFNYDLQPYEKESYKEDAHTPPGITITDNGDSIIVEYVKNKPQYPKTYDECYEIMNIPENQLIKCGTYGYKAGLLSKFQELLICRDAYRKIAGEEMGLSEPWKPDWKNGDTTKYVISRVKNKIELFKAHEYNYIFAFPTEEMRDAFYENFKDLIEQCKEFL